MDNELILCDVSQVMRQHNKLRGGIPSDVAVDRIRNIVTPHGHWIAIHKGYVCSNCNKYTITINDKHYCFKCGAKMVKEGNNENVNGK